MEAYCACDFETFYDSKNGYGLKQMTPYEYVNDPRFDAYMVAIYGNDKNGNHVEYVGFPEEFDWSQLDGVTLVAHNASFDGLVYNRLIELGKINARRSDWVCTADLAAFLRVPRNLKGAAFQLLGVTMSKAVRASMDGVKYREQTAATQASWREYAGLDAELCFKIWEQFGPQWPEQERLISQYNRMAGWRGVAVDKAALDAGEQKLFEVLRDAEKLLPWVAQGEKAGSAPALRRYARELGITDVPASLKKDDPAMVAWVDANKDKYPFIKARLTHASCTPHYARLRSMKRLLDDNDVIRFDLLAHGTNTGRVAASSEAKSGVESMSGKFNPLNIPKKPVFGVDIRGMLVPRAGYKFMIYDYASVESRIVQWYAGNTAFLELARRENIYQATAKILGWYPMEGTGLKKENPDLYALSKACLSGETLVLTDSGYKRIVEVLIDDKVWDGQEWVTHEGVVCHGERNDISEVNSERFTMDHKIYSATGSRPACLAFREGDAEMAWRYANSASSDWDDLRKLAYAVIYNLAKDFWQTVRSCLRVRMSTLRAGRVPPLAQPREGDFDAVQLVRETEATKPGNSLALGPKA